jgi:hypothetical protein
MWLSGDFMVKGMLGTLFKVMDLSIGDTHQEIQLHNENGVGNS